LDEETVLPGGQGSLDTVSFMRRDRVLAAIDPERLITLLRDMLRFRSFSASPGELELARWLAGELTARAFEVAQPAIGTDRVNTLAWLRGSGAGPSLMLNGHIDTNMLGLGWLGSIRGGVGPEAQD
jgi:acetylornithine deacetylase